MPKFKFRDWFRADADRYTDLIKPARKVTPEGTISVTLGLGINHDEYQLGLFSSIDAGDEINEHLLKRAINRAIFSTDLAVDFSATQLLELISKKYWLLSKSDQNDYVVVTGLHIAELPAIKSFRFEDVDITIHDSADDAFFVTAIAARNEIASDVFQSPADRGPDPDFFVTLRTKADATETAYYRAKQRFDELRGLMNFVFNKTKHAGWGWGFGEPTPLNDIAEARFATIHTTEGTLAEPFVRLERHWRMPTKPAGFSKGQEVREKNFSSYFDRIAEDHGLSNVTRKALRMYCRALDSANWEQSFVQLWAVLEKLSCTGKGEAHTKIVERVASTYKDAWLAKISLNQLSAARNIITHDESFLTEPQTKVLLHQLNKIVCDMIRIVALNKIDVASVVELREFLEATTNTDQLKATASRIEKVLRFRGVFDGD